MKDGTAGSTTKVDDATAKAAADVAPPPSHRPLWEELRASERRLAQELSDARMLQRISSEFISEKQPGAIYGQLLDAAMALMRADAGSVQMLDPSGTYLQLLASRNFAPESVAFWQRVDAGSGSSCGQALKRGTRVVVSDNETSDFMRGTRDLDEHRRCGLGAVQSTPLVARDGRPIGMISTHWRTVHEPEEKDFALFDVLARQAADLIERTRTEAALRESEERLRLALLASDMGTWLYRIHSDEQILDESMRRLAGLPPDAAAMPLDAFLRAAHDEDRDQLRAELERCMREGVEIDAEFRVRWPDGSLHWLKDRGKVFPGPDGRPLYMTGVAVDITDRRRLEEELREADRKKDEFLAMLGHELRNPLAPLRAAVETLRRRPDGPAVERAYDLMERQIEHLTRLVDDLLDVSRITRGLVELRKKPVPLAQIADQAVEMAIPFIVARQHELISSLPREPLWVAGDATRLTQVIFNLLNNAAKYTEPGGKIWLSVEQENQHAVVRVRDNGGGMPPELLPRVFDLFTQGERKLDRSQGGLGLGLALVKRLVEMHGGKVEARSEGPDRGSEFTLRLPALTAEEAIPQPVRTPGPPPVPVQVDRALVVDDNPDVAEPIAWMFEGLAREVKMVHSGQSALELVGQWRPNLIVCDIGMPRMDGYETCRRLRQIPGMEKVLIASVSGYGSAEDRTKSQEAGFDRHLVKPIGRTALEELVRSAAARQ